MTYYIRGFFYIMPKACNTHFVYFGTALDFTYYLSFTLDYKNLISLKNGEFTPKIKNETYTERNCLLPQ